MLESLHLKDVGPASEMEMQLTERLNMVTGDNGLGKSFLLDIAWWALTHTWARGVVVPNPAPVVPQLSYRYGGGPLSVERTGNYDRRTESWSQLYPTKLPCLVLYAQVDGGFSVWDPVRNSDSSVSLPSSSSSSSNGGAGHGFVSRPRSYIFSSSEIWDGNDLCEGLIRDWASWQREKNTAYTQLLEALKGLSPSPSEPLEPGELRKISLDDPKRYPTLKMSYGQEVAVIHASAGIRRIIALAYLLVWAWQEHIAACALRGEEPTNHIVFLVDEVEAHLHPQWQRRIVPALLDVMSAITGEHDAKVQLIATTHSPLVLASVESQFDPDKDSWFDLDMDQERREVTLQKRPYVRRGDVSNWLTSEAFDLKMARSLEAEEAIMAARAVLLEPIPNAQEIRRVDGLLRSSLGDIDPFWVRWSAFRDDASAAVK